MCAATFVPFSWSFVIWQVSCHQKANALQPFPYFTFELKDGFCMWKHLQEGGKSSLSRSRVSLFGIHLGKILKGCVDPVLNSKVDEVIVFQFLFQMVNVKPWSFSVGSSVLPPIGEANQPDFRYGYLTCQVTFHMASGSYYKTFHGPVKHLRQSPFFLIWPGKTDPFTVWGRP